MKLSVNNSSTVVEVSPQVFEAPYNESLIHQAVIAYRAGARQGSRAQKNRSAVNATNAKPWAQKGTGRARAGDAKSPIWRGGGVTFANKKQDFSQKINKKMYHRAMVSILSELLRQDRLVVVEELKVAEPKTKLLVEKLKTLSLGKTLIVTVEPDLDLYLAARNLPGVYICEQAAVDPLSLIAVDKVCITVAALKALDERMA